MKSIDLLQPTVNELRERLQDAQNRPPVPVDDLVLIPSVVHRQ